MVIEHTYHVIGRYNFKGEHMVHRVYICSNLKSLFAVHKCDQLEGCTNTNHIMSSFYCSSMFVLKQHVQFQEGEQGWTLFTTTTTSASINDFESRTTQNQEGENDENMSYAYDQGASGDASGGDSGDGDDGDSDDDGDDGGGDDGNDDDE